MGNLTIKELKRKKEDLEMSLLTSIRKELIFFEEETAIYIKDINLVFVDTTEMDKPNSKQLVDVEVSLNI